MQFCPDKAVKWPENGQLLDVISSTALIPLVLPVSLCTCYNPCMNYTCFTQGVHQVQGIKSTTGTSGTKSTWYLISCGTTICTSGTTGTNGIKGTRGVHQVQRVAVVLLYPVG